MLSFFSSCPSTVFKKISLLSLQCVGSFTEKPCCVGVLAWALCCPDGVQLSVQDPAHQFSGVCAWSWSCAVVWLILFLMS